MSTTYRLAVISAGLSSPSSSRVLADELAAATVRHLSATAAGVSVAVDVVELRPLAHELMDNLLTGFPPPALKAAIATVTGADAVIAVTPIFTASYSSLFKAFFDVLDPESLTGMPVLIGATGGSERHSLALDHAVRPLLAYLRALVVPTAVYAASTDFGAAGGDTAGLAGRIDRAGAELAVLLAGRPARSHAQSADDASAADDFDHVIDFEKLLAG
ncbi:hypothetical protein FDO65_15290 [Nakamurella flava]|uniref:NADPH-dependent FMN reductase-like domain-containing protein n=1 Tax=Nakamurella flava TaxID=2576308 RepID=A0A4U6QFI3_9ACTN|nr:CE1759 family FMN reductase [Nakamurella flava]TKV58861.1 hypothetical protein FDO65_15290 [Nakamurella flava]